MPPVTIGPDKLCEMPLARPAGRALWLLTVLLCVALCGEALAFDLRVGTRTKLTADVHADGTRVTVDGHLRDNVGQGIKEKSIRVDFTPEEGATVARDARTDRTGRFYVPVVLKPGTYKVHVAYGGQEHYYSASALEAVVVSERGVVVLELQVPKLVLSSAESVMVRVAATDGATPVPELPLTIEIGGLIVESRTGPEGTAAVPHPLGGVHDPKVPIRVSFEGSETYAEASAATDIRVLDGPRIEVEASSVRARLDRGVRVEGRVEDRFGPVGGGVIDITLAHQGIEGGRYSTRTKEDGEYVLFISEDRLKQGRMEVRARLNLGRQSVEATPVKVEVNKTGEGLLPWLLAIVLGTCVVVLLAFAIRDGWQSWQRRRPKARRARQTLKGARAPAIVPLAMDDGEPPPKATPEGIAGLLWDSQIEAPIEGGQVEVLLDDGGADLDGFERATEPEVTSARGRFAFGALPPGRYVLRASSKGFISATYRFGIPHGGQLSWFRFPLTPVRVVVRDLYEDMVEDVVRESESWGRLTPRQVRRLLLRAVDVAVRQPMLGGEEGYEAFKARLDEVLQTTRANGELSSEAVVHAVVVVLEEVYYSQRAHDEALAVVMERLTEEVRRQVSVEALQEAV